MAETERRRLWAERRAALGISIRRLAGEAKISHGLISLMETGRMTPSSDEYDRIIAALEKLAAEKEVA